MQWIVKLNDFIGKAMAWLVVILTVVVFYDVCMRFLFRAGSPALQELQWHFFALVFLLGAAATYTMNGHVRVEVFYQKFSNKTQLLINTAGDLFVLLPLCILVINSSIPFIETAWQMNESSPDPGGLPWRWIIKAAIPAGFVLLALQAVSNIISNIDKISNSGER